MEITTCNGHDPLISPIVHMNNHGGPPFNPFYMIGHHPDILKVPTRLPLSSQMHYISWTNLRHLEDEHLVPIITLTGEMIRLDVGPISNALEFCNAIHNTEFPQIFERGNLRAKVWEIQLSTTLKHRFKLFKGEETVCVIIATKEELTNNVIVGFKDDLVVWGLRRMLNVLLDALPVVSAVSNLHGMLMSTDMNAGSLGRFLPMHVEYFCLA